MSTVHVIGAGVAGLAAALALVHAGRRVVLYEAAPTAGGRARALPDGTDNGTHALLGANPAALRFLDSIGARDRWVEPEPDGLPVLDLGSGMARRVALSPLAWADPLRRPAGLTAGGLVALLRLMLPGPDRPVATAFAAHQPLYRALVEPLTVAALNTPAEEASARLLGAVLRRLGAPGAGRLYVAERGLGSDLIAPALATLACYGAFTRLGARLRGLVLEAERVAALDFGGVAISLPPGDAVVLALPPWEAARLIPGLKVPEAHAPILNLHFTHESAEPPRFIGLTGGFAHWMLVRAGGVSVTVSAADAVIGLPVEQAACTAWAEVRRAAIAFGLPGPWPRATPRCRAVKERRATPRHGPGARPVPPRLPLSNLALAGDWTESSLPATLEAAIRSGTAAAAALTERVPA